MNEYLMQWDCTMIGELAWEYPYTMASDAMAIDYAMRHGSRVLEYNEGITSLLVWRKHDQKLIARITIDNPVVRNEMENG
jgi:hypothetical protein